MPQALVLHSPYLGGDNHGIYHQHVTALQWLMAGDPDWRIAALDAFDPALAEAALACDLLVIHMLANADLESIIRLRRARGLPTIFEIYDNIVAPGEWLQREHGLRSPFARQNLLYHASLCDALHVYSPAQLELFGRVNANSSVVDYYIPLPEERPRKEAGFVLGWAGSRTHRIDLQRIAAAVVDFCTRHGDVVFAYMGDAAMFADLFGAIPVSQVRLRPFSPHPEYLAFARTWHAGLAPLRDTPFNRLRSDAKFVEYASAGVVAVLEQSQTFAAHGGHALLFSDAGGLTDALETLYADRERIDLLAERALRWAHEHRGKEALQRQRRELYRAVLPREPRPANAMWSAQETTGCSARLSEATTLAGAKDFDASLAICHALLAKHPGYAQAQALLMQNLLSLERFTELLEFASRPDLSPVCADTAAEMRFRVARRNGDGQTDLAAIESPVRRLRLNVGKTADIQALFEELLAHQPYEYFALVARLRKLLGEDPGSPEISDLLERACLVYPEAIPDPWRPARLAPYLPPCTTPFITAPTA